MPELPDPDPAGVVGLTDPDMTRQRVVSESYQSGVVSRVLKE